MPHPPPLLNTTRVQDAAGFVGTVAFYGEINNATYVGVVWDDASRGKHDGAILVGNNNEWKRYFTCEPNRGSLVKAHKLQWGHVLNEAWLKEHQFVAVDDPTLQAPNQQLPHRFGNKQVEFYGEVQLRERQQADALDTWCLRRCALHQMDLPVTAHVQHLDVAGNLFSDWASVQPLWETFPNLQVLNLASNRLGDSVPRNLPIHANLVRLNLSRTGLLSVDSLVAIGRSVPQLQELGCAYNDWSAWTQHDDENTALAEAFPTLHTLDVSHTQLVQLRALSKLPRLRTLNANHNPQLDIRALQQEGFEQLADLQLEGVEVSEDDLEGCFSKLTSLRLESIPRPRILTLLPALEELNGSRITDEERQRAERRQRRIEQATECWTVLTIRIECRVPSHCLVQPLQRRIPVDLTVQDVLALAIRNFDLERGPTYRLYVQRSDGLPEALEDGERSLGYYGIDDGAVLLLDQRVEEDESKGEAQDSWRHKVDQQERELLDFQERQRRQGTVTR